MPPQADETTTTDTMDRSEQRALARIVKEYKEADDEIIKILYGARPAGMTCESIRRRATTVFADGHEWSGNLQKKFKKLLNKEIDLRYWATHIFRFVTTRDNENFPAQIRGHRHYYRLLQDIRTMFGKRYPKHSQSGEHAQRDTMVQNRYELLRVDATNSHEAEMTDQVHELLSTTEPDDSIRAGLERTVVADLEDLSVVAELLSDFGHDFLRFQGRLAKATANDADGKVDVMEIAIDAIILFRVWQSRCAATFGSRDCWESDDGLLTSQFLKCFGLDKALDVYDRVSTIWHTFEGENGALNMLKYIRQDVLSADNASKRTTVLPGSKETDHLHALGILEETEFFLSEKQDTDIPEKGQGITDEAGRPELKSHIVNSKVLQGDHQEQNIRSIVMLLLRVDKKITQARLEQCACEGQRLRIPLVKVMLESFASKKAVCKIDALMAILIFCGIENMFGTCNIKRYHAKIILRDVFNQYLLQPRPRIQHASKVLVVPELPKIWTRCHPESSEDCDDIWSVGLDFATSTACHQEWLYNCPTSSPHQPIIRLLNVFEFLKVKGARHRDKAFATLISRIMDIYGVKQLKDDTTKEMLRRSWTAHTKFTEVTDGSVASSRLTTKLIANASAGNVKNPSKCLLSTLLRSDFGIDPRVVGMTAKQIESDVDTCLEKLNIVMREQLHDTPLIFSLVDAARRCHSQLCFTDRSGQLMPKWEISESEAQSEMERLSRECQYAFFDGIFCTRMAIPMVYFVDWNSKQEKRKRHDEALKNWWIELEQNKEKKLDTSRDRVLAEERRIIHLLAEVIGRDVLGDYNFGAVKSIATIKGLYRMIAII